MFVYCTGTNISILSSYKIAFTGSSIAILTERILSTYNVGLLECVTHSIAASKKGRVDYSVNLAHAYVVQIYTAGSWGIEKSWYNAARIQPSSARRCRMKEI